MILKKYTAVRISKALILYFGMLNRKADSVFLEEVQIITGKNYIDNNIKIIKLLVYMLFFYFFTTSFGI